MLRVGIVAGVYDERVVHHASTALGNTFKFLHKLNQHATVVLADLDPDRVIGLLHVAEIVALLLHAQTFPRSKDLTTPRADRKHTGNTRLESRDAKV